MATLANILAQTGGRLVEVQKGDLVEKINIIKGNKVIMDSGAVYSNTNSGWELKRPPLDEQKDIKNGAIDLKTQSIIAMGFVHNGITFSLSQNAQQNWTALLVMLLAGKLTFPHKVTRKDDRSYYIQDAAEFSQFIDTAVYAVESQLEYGRQLKAAVLAATTQAELDAVVDPR